MLQLTALTVSKLQLQLLWLQNFNLENEIFAFVTSLLNRYASLMQFFNHILPTNGLVFTTLTAVGPKPTEFLAEIVIEYVVDGLKFFIKYEFTFFVAGMS